MKKPIATIVILALAAPVLAGCGTTRSDRALSGAGIGAAGGAALMAVTGGPILAGAAVGAAAGAVTGAVTHPDEINLDGHHKHGHHHKKEK
jgi:predicted small secreted protein